MEKTKNSLFMRFVAFTLAAFIFLSLATVMVYHASAEESTSADTSISYLGQLGNYDCIKFRYTSGVSIRSLVDRFNSYGDGKYVQGCVFGYFQGKFYTYTNNSINYQVGSNSLVFSNAMFYPSWLEKPTYASAEFCFTESNGSVCFTYRYLNNSDYSYGSLVNIARNCTLADFPTTYGDTFYAVFTSSDTSWSTTECNNFKADVIDRLSDSNYSEPDSSTSPKAEFVTCASYEPDDNSIPLWFKDFTAEGKQYPLFTYYIHDNGNKHSYSLKLSYSSSCKDDVKKVFNLTENNNDDYRDIIQDIRDSFTLQGVRLHDFKPYLHTYLNLKFPEKLSYNQAFVLSSSEMDFSASGDNKVYTICLSDYSDILQCLIYKAEIIDNNTGLVLDTTYFASKQTFNKGNSGFGSKIYDYGDKYDDMINDIKNDTPSVDPEQKDDFTTDGDIIQTDRHDYYSGLKIDDIFGTLESSADSLRSFFQTCMTIIPSGIIAIILGGLSIVIILRILGR